MDKWKIDKSQEVLNTPPFNILEKTYKKPRGLGNMQAYVVDCPDWVNVIGLTKNNEVLLIKQFRFGTDDIELEIPGGVVEHGEDPIIAAKREFEEETGYQSKQWEKIGTVDANPAIMNNKCYTFLAKSITPSGEINFDPDEMIEHKLVPLENVRELVENGLITNTFIIAAFHWFALKTNSILF